VNKITTCIEECLKDYFPPRDMDMALLKCTQGECQRPGQWFAVSERLYLMLPPSRRLFLPLSVCLSVCQDNSKSCWRILMKFLWRSGMVTMATTLYFGGGWTGWGQTGWGHG